MFVRFGKRVVQNEKAARGIGRPVEQGCGAHGVTVNTVALAALPPGALTPIFPVRAPVGTVAAICVPEFTVKLVAFTPPNVMTVAPLKPEPVMVTTVPTGPLVGVKLLMTGTMLKGRLLVSAPEGVDTVMNPVTPSAGIVAVMNVSA